MDQQQYRIILVAVLLLLHSVSVKSDGRYSHVYVFGDSISDNGNGIVFLRKFLGLRPETNFPFPFFENRASNGKVALELVAERLSDNPHKAYFEHTEVGTNFAVFGACTDGRQDFLAVQYDLKLQRNMFWNRINQRGGRFDQDALYIFLIGGNDILAVRKEKDATVDQVIGSAIAVVKNNLVSLLNASARKILVINLPDIGSMPKIISAADADPVEQTRTRELTSRFNRELTEMVTELRDSLPDSRRNSLVEFDLNRFTRELGEGTSGHEFQHRKVGCVRSYKPKHLLKKPESISFVPECGDNAEHLDKFLYFDNLHFSARAHRLIADEILHVLTP